ncbi:3-hydroxyacyl-CoA dehydrogenase family protein [Streptomyces drozdowiczii]
MEVRTAHAFSPFERTRYGEPAARPSRTVLVTPGNSAAPADPRCRRSCPPNSVKTTLRIAGHPTPTAAWPKCTRSTRSPLYAAPPLLQRIVDAGRLGRKSGSGFYPYA